MKMGFSIGVWLLLIGLLVQICTGQVEENNAKNASPKVIGLEVTEESLKEHHTNHFKIEEGFAIRRGQKFVLRVKTDLALDEAKMGFVLYNDQPKEYHNPEFETKLLRKEDATTYLVQVFTDAEKTAVGKYEDLSMIVDEFASTPGNIKSSSFVYQYPFPVYLLFNPWLKEDSKVYLPTEELRREHILNEYGNVFCGSANSYMTTKWYYGQSNQITLDAAFHLISKLDRSFAHDAIRVVQTMSQHQGMMRKTDGSILVGFEDSILEGNWGTFPFDDDTSPEIWVSTTDILTRWKETGRPAQYGQCWVFAALQNGLMRGVGVGSRQISAFGAWQDASNQVDSKKHRLHHVIDEYYDINGTSVYNLGRAWNYHSWNDIWLQREKEEFSGWQSLDGTPPGKIGPAPLKAVRALDEAHPFNITDVISTVHSTTRTFLVDCTGDVEQRKKEKKGIKGCLLKKQLKYDHSGLNLILTTETAENQTLVEKNITDEFVDPSLDAIIPFDGDDDINSGHGRKLRGSKKTQTQQSNLKIFPTSYGVVAGSPVDGYLELQTNGLVQDTVATLNLLFTMETQQGENVKTIYSSTENVLIKGSKVVLPYSIDSSAYLRKDLGDVFIRIVATAETENGDDVFLAKEVLNVISPSIALKVGQVDTETGTIPVSARFRNPHGFVVNNICLTIFSHELDFVNDNNKNNVTSCQTLQPNQELKIETTLKQPEKPGTYYVVSTIQGNYLPFSTSHAEIAIEQGRKKEQQQPSKEKPLFQEIIFKEGFASSLE